ncbi:FixH family protein [Paenibacillus lautus]|uniref:FixH family protein n=1 Tax=Paenibacillus lautus TaxID=1401 RepID=UPI001C119B28|nr:FixH family protein [Paenibacillus lautus]MBU5347252.1 FixH family protein [Paenibacillus lautus]
MKTRWGMALLLLFMIAAMILYRQVNDRSKVENLYTDGQLRMEIQTVQSIVEPMKETSFQVFITELPEKPIVNADIKLNLKMPDMFCGVFPAEIVESKPGVYSATAVPVMQGLWQAEAVLRWEDQNVKVRTLFNVR